MFTFQFSSVPQLCLTVTPWPAPCQFSLSTTTSQGLLKLMSIDSVMPFSHLIFCSPLLFLLSIFPSIRVLSKESVLRIWWSKYWSFSFSPSNEYSGLISFRMDWWDSLGVQGSLINIQLQIMKFFHLVLCLWISSSVSQFTVFGNLNLYPTVV